jgi:hypothetical protein
MTGTDALHKRLEKLESQMSERSREVPHITCYWGNEPIPHTPGALIIKTTWGGETLGEDGDDVEHRSA